MIYSVDKGWAAWSAWHSSQLSVRRMCVSTQMEKRRAVETLVFHKLTIEQRTYIQLLHQTVKKISLKPDPLTTWKFYMHCTLYVLSTVVYSCMKLYLKLHVHVAVNTLRALLSRSIKFTNKNTRERRVHDYLSYYIGYY